MYKLVRTFLTMQRFEVLLAIFLPFFLILESALANGTVYAGGVMDIHDPRSWVAFGRGLFFEVLTYVCAKLTRLFLVKNKGGQKWVALVPGFVSLWCVIVSAGNNLGWVIGGGDFVGVFSSMGHFMPPAFMVVYEGGLGLLLPVSVGALAVFDVSHLIHEAIEHSHMENEGLRVAESEMHRTAYLGSQKKQKKIIQEAYDAIAEKRATAYIAKINSGDMSFGANDPKAIPAPVASPGIRRLAAGPVAASPSILQAQVSQPGPSTGGTQPIVMPPVGSPVSPLQAQPGLLHRVGSMFTGQ